ncbi:MAG: hypothetical protein HQL06_00030 [Nitrospirae bacterium]|nr:hypothetical protein [Nitrospirota bacterium]
MAKLKQIMSISGILLIGGLFCLLSNVELEYIVNRRITIFESYDLETWEKQFITGAYIVCAFAAFISVLWYGLTQWHFKVVDWKSVGKRPLWLFLFFIIPIAAFLFGLVYLKDYVEQGIGWPAGFYAINSMLCYYLSTLFCSPVAFKYTPIGATLVRYWLHY